MALLWIDGFEGYGTGGDASPSGILTRRYADASPAANFDIITGRTPTFYGISLMAAGGNPTLITPALTTDDTLIVAFAFKITAIDRWIFRMLDDVTEGMGLKVESDGELGVYRVAVQLGKTSGLSLVADTWYYIQYKVKCHNTAGEYELKLGTSTVLSATGVDTRAGAHNYHNKVKFSEYNEGSNKSYDDFSVCDSTGSENNDFIGNCNIYAIYPDGDDTANWSTVVPGPNHYEAVDETVVDDDTSYVEEDTVNITDLYDYGALPIIGDIRGLQINTDCRETDVTSYSLMMPIKSGGSQYDGSTYLVGSITYRTICKVAETDPNTGNLWTESGVNAAKVGIKVA